MVTSRSRYLLFIGEMASAALYGNSMGLKIDLSIGFREVEIQFVISDAFKDQSLEC